jgi:hypothetical protein
MTKIAGKDITTPDLAVMGAGLVAFIASFLPWFRVSVPKVSFGDQSFGGGSVSANAWNSNVGFLAWFGCLLLLAVGAVVAGRIFAGFVLPKTSFAGPALILLAASALGTLLILLRWLTQTHFHSFGFWLALASGIVQLVFLVPAFQASGEKLPEFNRPSSEPPAPPTA